MNLPNLLASLRILLAPVLFALLVYGAEYFAARGWHHSWLNYFAALVFTIASMTDFFDGYIARCWDQKTTLGAILDPLADKMLTLAAFFGLALDGRVNAFLIYLILVREFFITGLRVAIASEGRSVAAGFSGKIKTVLQMLAIGFLLMQWPGGEALFYACVFFTLYSGTEYVFRYAKSL